MDKQPETTARWPDMNDPKWAAVIHPDNQRKLLAHDIEQFDPKQCYCKTLESYLVAIGWRRV
jgi:hypothetical protein